MGLADSGTIRLSNSLALRSPTNAVAATFVLASDLPASLVASGMCFVRLTQGQRAVWAKEVVIR